MKSAASVAMFVVLAAALGACTAQQGKVASNTTKRSKEYFAESEYGVKASPRVTNSLSNLPRGGGRDQIGKPYMVRGKMYYPKEDKSYRKVGRASWYGSAFHGRLTANGEVYDMTHLTAAHPTMPLPSYARVTNKENGASVIVRVNDRGPYANDRIIDLSQRAAQMLDYMHDGTAQVEVEYVGRAPLDGNDESFLVASYRPGNAAPDPSDGLPAGVMIAMNGPTPQGSLPGVKSAGVAFPGEGASGLPVVAPPMPAFREPPVAGTDIAAVMPAAGDIELPAFGPIAPQRPTDIPFGPADHNQLAMSYAPSREATSRDPFAALQAPSVAPVPPVAASDPFVAVGSFADRNKALALARTLEGAGRVSLETSSISGRTVYAVVLRPLRGGDLDQTLQAAWAHGAPDAFAVRD